MIVDIYRVLKLSLLSAFLTRTGDAWRFYQIKPCTDVGTKVIDLRLTCDSTFKLLAIWLAIEVFQYAEYFTCNPLISHPIFKQFSPLILDFHNLSDDFSYVMMWSSFLLNEN